MGKKFWLQFAMNEALDVAMAFAAVATDDTVLQQKTQTAESAIKDLLNYLTSKPVK